MNIWLWIAIADSMLLVSGGSYFAWRWRDSLFDWVYLMFSDRRARRMDRKYADVVDALYRRGEREFHFRRRR